MLLLFIISSIISYVITQCEALGYCYDHGYSPGNGTRQPEPQPLNIFFPDAAIRYKCSPNYYLKPNIPVQRCVANGQGDYDWQPKARPKCVQGNDCPMVPDIKHGKITSACHPTNSYWLAGCELQYTCQPNYELVPSSQRYRNCSEGRWSGVNPKCVLAGCYQPDGGNYFPVKNFYEPGEVVRYYCIPVPDTIILSCRGNNEWSGTSCTPVITTTQMPVVPEDHTYCPIPSPLENGDIKCCLESQASGINSTQDPSYCCPKRGIVEFVCNSGYSLEDQLNQWICGSEGKWFELSDINSSDHSLVLPICRDNSTREEPNAFDDAMLKQVFGVAAGVLVILTIIMVFALCRPKLIDMKRRWRELRDDEDELIIDGRRILLPSYEEATTSRGHFNPEEIDYHNSTNDVPAQFRSENALDTPLEPITLSSRLTSSSDEEMLVPETSTMQEENMDQNAQAMILIAGTSAHSSVMINHPPPSASNSSPYEFLETICPNVALKQPANKQSVNLNASRDSLDFPISSSTINQPESFCIHINSNDPVESTLQPEHTGIKQSHSTEDSLHPILQNIDHMHTNVAMQTPTNDQEEMGSTAV